MVTICTASLTFRISTFFPHTVFICFVWIWEQTAIISLYSINWVVYRRYAKLRKATTDFVMSVCPSVRMEQLGYHWTAFREILCLSILRKPVKELKCIKIWEENICFAWRPINIFDQIPPVCPYKETCKEKCYKFVEEIKRHILCSKTFSFLKPCCLWDNVEKCCKSAGNRWQNGECAMMLDT